MVASYISTTYTTAGRIITQAMENAEILAEGQDPSSEALVKAMNRLNDVLNALQLKGLRLWKLVDTSITLTAGTSQYTLQSGGSVDVDRPLNIERAYYKDANNIQREVTPISWQELLNLGDMTQQGSIVNYFVNKGKSGLTVTFWQIPDTTEATGTMHLLVRQTTDQVSALTDGVDVPREWYLALTWLLAAELCTGQPESIIARCEGKARMYKDEVLDGDVEDTSMQLTMDNRYYGSREFD